MKILIKTFVGKDREFYVEPNETVHNLLLKIHDREGCAPGSYTLVGPCGTVSPKIPACGHDLLSWGRLLQEMGIMEGSKLIMTGRLPEGYCADCRKKMNASLN
jgi:hypothetical protein